MCCTQSLKMVFHLYAIDRQMLIFQGEYHAHRGMKIKKHVRKMAKKNMDDEKKIKTITNRHVRMRRNDTGMFIDSKLI